jgi:hypothetical protein
MKIDRFQLYHGAALTQLVEHPPFKALNKASGRYGHYQLNTDRHLFVKYASGLSPWHFTYTGQELAAISEDRPDHHVFLVMACGEATVCALSLEEFHAIADHDNENGQWLRVEAPPRRQMRVYGSRGHLLVPHNAYPAKLFE